MKKLIIVFLSLALLLGTFYYFPLSFGPLNKLLIRVLEKRLDAKIDYKSIRLEKLYSLHVEDVNAAGKGGVTIFIKKGEFSYNVMGLFSAGRLEIRTNLEDVVITGKASIVELLSDFLSVGPLKNLSFDTIKGSFFMGKEDTIIQNLTAKSGLIRFNIDGVTQKDNSINLRLRLAVNNKLSESIPKDIWNGYLKKESGPWVSILIGLTGNYKKPSLRLISERFHLDIKTNDILGNGTTN